MTTTKRVFVLVGDEQTPLAPSDVAEWVSTQGFRSTAARTGFSETTLRGFLADNGYIAKRAVSYEKQEYDPGLDQMRPVEAPVGG